MKEWQGRALEWIYPFIWLDAIHYKVKENSKYVTKGVGIDGKKEVLGLYLSESEGANFWLSVLTDLQNRGVEDILISSVDGLKGFSEAIRGSIIIESVHRQFRKLTNTKGAFPNENSLLKLLYLGIMNASKKWTKPIKNWALTLGQLSIIFEGRFEQDLKV